MFARTSTLVLAALAVDSVLAQTCDPATLFGPPQRLDAGDGPTGVSLGDLDGDGNLDLIAANSGIRGNDLTILMGRGDGSFDPQQNWPVGDGPRGVKLKDLDGDGDLDIATPNAFRHDVSVLLGRGDGSFEPEQRYSVGDYPQEVSFGDLDGDRVIDMAVVTASGAVSVLLGRGNGTFEHEQRFGVGLGSGSVALGDLNGDSVLDMVVTNQGGFDMSVLLGRGDGTFQTEERLLEGDRPTYAVLRDLDGDGVLDMVASTRSTSGPMLFVLSGLGDGGFELEHQLDAGGLPGQIVLGDLNGDGVTDITVTNSGAGEFNVLLGRGSGMFGPRHAYEPGSSLALGDLDGDGDLDMAVGIGLDDEVGIFLNRCGPFASCAADFDGDGALTIFDFLEFQYLFDAGDLAADFDGDGALTIFDFLAFQNAFDAGCP